MVCTLVTAFYPIKSKFPVDQYLQWTKTILLLEAPIVLFTEEYLVDTFTGMRGTKPIKIICIPFNNLDTWTKYGHKWVEHHSMDPEKNIHTPELYAIWAQKAFFVEKAIQINPFNTDYFFWCDIGAFRNPNISKSILESFPQPRYLQNNKLILQAINELHPSDKVMKEDGIIGPMITDTWNQCRLVGGLWGGSIEACLNWKTEYQMILEKYFDANRFAGKDQIVMLSTYLQNPQLALIVKSTISEIDNWFFLQHLLSKDNVEYRLDSSYKMSQPIVSVNIMGGLGNQLFQVCTAYAYSKKMGGQLQIQHKTENGNRPLYFNSILSKFQPYIVQTLPSNLEVWNEQMPTKFSDIGSLNTQGKYLIGYLQSSKYFYNDSIKQDIKNLLTPEPLLLQQIRNKYKYLCDNSDRVVVIHCRRTDYITAAWCHGPLEGNYYNKAINTILEKVSNPIFLLCGDDNNFWNEISNEISPIYNHKWFVVPSETDINTFILLQQFQHYIISNSTFIWWAVWLSKSQNVIAPSKWFGPGGPSEYEDIYEPSWIRI